MDISTILKKLGFSIHHQSVKRIIEDKFFELKKSDASTGLMSLFGNHSSQHYGPTKYKDKDLGLFLSFSKKKYFLLEYKHLRFEEYPADEEELILTEITIEPKSETLKLPFNLHYLMSGDRIKNLLGDPLDEIEFDGQIKWRYGVAGAFLQKVTLRIRFFIYVYLVNEISSVGNNVFVG